MTDLATDLATLRLDRRQPAARPWRWGVLLVVSILLFAALVYGFRVQRPLDGAEVEAIRALAVPNTYGGSSGATILTASGYLVARRNAVVSATVQGRLSDLQVEEGSHVREGEVIARLESAEYEAHVERTRAAVERADADLAEYRRQFRLAEDLGKQGLVAVDQREAAGSRVKIAEAALRQAQAEFSVSQASLEHTRIRAPFTGTVIKKMAEVGESVAPIPPGLNISTSSGAIVALADLNTLEVEADVSEVSVGKLGPGQPAEVTVEAFPDRRCRAVLRQIVPTADRTKATVQVKVTIIEKHSDFKPEMSAKVTFMEREDQGAGQSPVSPMVTIPKDAVTMREGRAVVFEVRDGRARQRTVVVGPDRDGRVIVKTGVSAGEMLIAHPPETLRDGDAVRVRT